MLLLREHAESKTTIAPAMSVRSSCAWLHDFYYFLQNHMNMNTDTYARFFYAYSQKLYMFGF
jgi:hypothetical protein